MICTARNGSATDGRARAEFPALDRGAQPRRCVAIPSLATCHRGSPQDGPRSLRLDLHCDAPPRRLSTDVETRLRPSAVLGRTYCCALGDADFDHSCHPRTGRGWPPVHACPASADRPRRCGHRFAREPLDSPRRSRGTSIGRRSEDWPRCGSRRHPAGTARASPRPQITFGDLPPSSWARAHCGSALAPQHAVPCRPVIEIISTSVCAASARPLRTSPFTRLEQHV